MIRDKPCYHPYLCTNDGIEGGVLPPSPAHYTTGGTMERDEGVRSYLVNHLRSTLAKDCRKLSLQMERLGEEAARCQRAEQGFLTAYARREK